MTNAPHMLPNSRTGNRYGSFEAVDHMAWDGLTNPYDGQSMGVFAEATADKYRFTREEQDAFAIESVKRAQAAHRLRRIRRRNRPGHGQRPARAMSSSPPTSSRASPTSPRFRP